jgi:hypothetical protein
MRNHPEFQLTKAYSPDPTASPETRADELQSTRSTGQQSKKLRPAKPSSRRHPNLKR